MTRSWSRRSTFIACGFALLVATAGAVGALVDGATFGNWTVRCDDSDSSSHECFIYQNLVLRESGQRVMQFAIGFVKGTSEPIALLSLPLGISLPPGARIQIDAAEARRIPVERCEPSGCRAGLKLDAEMIRQFETGRTLKVTFYDAERQPIEVPLSPDGFAVGLEALRIGAQP